MNESALEMELEGNLEPPMVNGELVFSEPWQGRVFGMARTLCGQGLYAWDEFRMHLIEQVGHWDREQRSTQQEYPYYDLFLAALEALLVEKSLLETGQLSSRFQEYLERPHGHDH